MAETKKVYTLYPLFATSVIRAMAVFGILILSPINCFILLVLLIIATSKDYDKS